MYLGQTPAAASFISVLPHPGTMYRTFSDLDASVGYLE